MFVGAGPGAPDLLTGRGARAIAAVGIVIWASSLVDQRILAHAGEHAEIVDSAHLPMEGVLPYYQRAAREQLTIARVHSGDPSLWGADRSSAEEPGRANPAPTPRQTGAGPSGQGMYGGATASSILSNGRRSRTRVGACPDGRNRVPACSPG